MENPEKHKLAQKNWRNENKEKASQLSIAWQRKNRDKVREYERKHYEKNREKINQQARERYASNPEVKLRAGRKSGRKRRAILRGNTTTKYTEQQVLDLYGSNCHLCGEPIDLQAPRSPRFANWQLGLHIDHLVPVANGGSDDIENVKPAHAVCNLKKGNKETNK
jgi:5-methylcytosine-specific restriction endonuclease McrA